ncbi:MAG: aminotransferase class V-fold PLP-dependent enzyme [Acidimicrobiales bacterium]|nr:aminotransferase class V-fold PLP-dependent enzyme [Acidimicrobiales bacterium]
MTASTPLPRTEFPVAERYCYLNHAGVASIPRIAAAAIADAAHDFAANGGLATGRWGEREEDARSAAARLMNVPTHDIALIKNTTEGLGFVANGLDWQPGDRVLVPDFEFPSTIYPWLALRDRGVVVELIEPVGRGRRLPVELFADALDRGPARLIAVSWVQFGRGWRVDLAELGQLCRDRGTLLCVDAIQGLGVIPADFEAWGVDFAMADAHKWLVGPLGIGALYVRGERRELLRPVEPGWASVAHREEWDNLELVFDDSARRFEGGSVNAITIAGFAASMELLLEVGVDRIWQHVDRLCSELAGGLVDAGASLLTERPDGVVFNEGRSGIVTFAVDGADPEDVCEALEQDGIVCSPRGGGIRLAPHGYNDQAEIERAVAAVAAIVRRGRATR